MTYEQCDCPVHEGQTGPPSGLDYKQLTVCGEDEDTDDNTRELLIATLKVNLDSGLLFARSSRYQLDPRKALKAQYAARRCFELVEMYLASAQDIITEKEFQFAENRLTELYGMLTPLREKPLDGLPLQILTAIQ